MYNRPDDHLIFLKTFEGYCHSLHPALSRIALRAFGRLFGARASAAGMFSLLLAMEMRHDVRLLDPQVVRYLWLELIQLRRKISQAIFVRYL